jgi:hypothetical protein
MPEHASPQPWRKAFRFLLLALALTASALCGFAFPGHAAQSEVIGKATRLIPEVGARFQGKPRELAVGADLHRGEQVWTAARARLDIKFIDGSSVTLGENARIVLDEFVFEQRGGVSTQVLRTLSGALRFIGGGIDQQRTGATKIITPVGTMTVKGTEFFVGPIDGAYGVFVYSGEVEVATSGGSVTLKEGEGTTLTRSSVAPTKPIRWRAAKIARANALVGY